MNTLRLAAALAAIALTTGAASAQTPAPFPRTGPNWTYPNGFGQRWTFPRGFGQSWTAPGPRVRIRPHAFPNRFGHGHGRFGAPHGSWNSRSWNSRSWNPRPGPGPQRGGGNIYFYYGPGMSYRAGGYAPHTYPGRLYRYPSTARWY